MNTPPILWLRRIPPIGWVVIMFTVVIGMLMVIYWVAARYGQPIIVADTPYVRYPSTVCPGELMIIEYRARRLRSGNQNLVAVSNWYNPETQTRYATAPSLYGAIFPDGVQVLRSFTEARVPESLPAGINEYWRAIAGQSGSLLRVEFEIKPADQCPNTEMEDQEQRNGEP